MNSPGAAKLVTYEHSVDTLLLPAVERLWACAMRRNVDDWETGELVTERFNSSGMDEVHLRPVTKSDLPILFEHQREPEANEMAAFPARDRDAFMAHWERIMGDETVVARTVVVGECVAGSVGCWTQEGRRLVGYWIGKEHWGKGVATQMLSLLLDLVADRPLYAHVARHNVASIRVLEKCGFVFCAKATDALDEPADGIEELVYRTP